MLSLEAKSKSSAFWSLFESESKSATRASSPRKVILGPLSVENSTAKGLLRISGIKFPDWSKYPASPTRIETNSSKVRPVPTKLSMKSRTSGSKLLSALLAMCTRVRRKSLSSHGTLIPLRPIHNFGPKSSDAR